MLEVGGRADKQKLTSRESTNSFLVRRWKASANEAAEKLHEKSKKKKIEKCEQNMLQKGKHDEMPGKHPRTIPKMKCGLSVTISQRHVAFFEK